jgi:hypothetical protein
VHFFDFFSSFESTFWIASSTLLSPVPAAVPAKRLAFEALS